MKSIAVRPRGLNDFRSEIKKAGSVCKALEKWLENLAEADRHDPAIWITRASADALRKRASELDAQKAAHLPLFGIPFAVKDNIHVAGLPTTAACPAAKQMPDADAPVVGALLNAGAICLGKANLDQFATGLVGTRSPFGIPKNVHHPDFIPGGSSSGSAAAVAMGLVPFALGTDTAGSGRVPAAFQGIFGWKPTRGLLSTRGVIPACRSLDCVSVFATNPSDLLEIASIVSQFDPLDPWSRPIEHHLRAHPAKPLRTIGVPYTEELEFFGDTGYELCWRETMQALKRHEVEIIEVTIRAFLETAQLLYQGPWIAERYAALKTFILEKPQDLLPVTRTILEEGSKPKAWEVFAAMDRLAFLRRESEKIWNLVDALCLPTTGTIYRKDEVEREPFLLNTNLGRNTNFFNLLDLCGIALPAGRRHPDGLPFGITLAMPAFSDERLLRWAIATTPLLCKEEVIELAVFGAHMRGLPLEKQLRTLGGEFLREDRTAPEYRMVDLDGKRPGVFRAQTGGESLALEVWQLPQSKVGNLMVQIPSPLGLGRVRLFSGNEILGFLCEPAPVAGCRDITQTGGWRFWLSQQRADQ